MAPTSFTHAAHRDCRHGRSAYCVQDKLHGTHEYEATREQEDYWPYLMDVLAKEGAAEEIASVRTEPPEDILDGSEWSGDADSRESGEDFWGVKVLRVFGQERHLSGPEKVIGVVKDRLEDQVVRRITG